MPSFLAVISARGDKTCVQRISFCFGISALLKVLVS